MDLISIVLSVAKLIKEYDSNRAPIILIDEAMAHLDDHHKKQLHIYSLFFLNI